MVEEQQWYTERIKSYENTTFHIYNAMSLLGYVTGNNSGIGTNSRNAARGRLNSNSSSISTLSASWKNGSNTTANDIFSHLTIRQIQALSREYRDKITVAKTDIHNIVGSKYRDLIDIAEDIDKMYFQSVQLDLDISELSYQSNKFVSFVSNDEPFTKFESSVRHQRAAIVRADTQEAILKNLLSVTLIGFDLNLHSGQAKKILPTKCILIAKYYYTIEHVFGTLLTTKPELKESLTSLKHNFNSYLENQLSSYTGDKTPFTLAGLLRKREISPEKFELDDDFDNVDEDDEEANEDEEEEHIVLSLTPIESYLIAYIILNNNNPELNTLSKIADSFITLRTSFISSIFSELLHSTHLHTINFFKLFKFLETTYELASIFFGISPFKNNHLSNSSFLNHLEQNTNSWMASGVIGFHNWFSNETVTFNEVVKSGSLPDLSKLTNSLNLFYDQILTSSEVYEIAIETFQRLSLGLRKLELENELPILIQVLSKEGKLSQVLNVFTKHVSHIYDIHLDALVNKDKDFKTIMTTVAYTSTTSTKNPLLFSQEINEILDNDLDRYMQKIASISSSVNDKIDLQIDKWFQKLHEYDTLLKKCCTSFGKKSNSTWGSDFSKKEISNKFDSLVGVLRLEFWKRVVFCVSELQELEAESDTLKSHYYFLNIIVRFKENLNAPTFVENEAHNVNIERFNELCSKFFSKIIKHVPTLEITVNKSFNELILQEETKTDETETDNEEGEDEANVDQTPIRPSFKTSSLLYSLSKAFATTSVESEGYIPGNIFIEPQAKDIFIELKDGWLIELAEKLSKNIKSTNKLESIADMIYILQFVHSRKIENIIDGIATQEEIDSKSIAAITKGIQDYYKSNLTLYLPLLL